MFRRIPVIITLLLSALVGCGGSDLSEDPFPTRESDGLLNATVRVGDGDSNEVVADEVVASLTPSLRGRDLVIYARSYDFNETLALVIDMDSANLPGYVDLSSHGVLYLEPGFGVGGGDLLFDGVPSGSLEIDGLVVAGSVISGRFSVLVPGYDTARPGEEIIASIEGSFVLPIDPLSP